MASSAQQSWVHPLTGISKSDIGNFIGKNGYLLRKFVYFPVIEEYRKSCGVDESAKVPMKIKIDSYEDAVSAEITTPSDQTDLTGTITKFLTKHESVFVKNKARKLENSGKPKVISFVFKTKMESHHIGKYVGSGGKNIKAIKVLCEEKIVEAKIDATSVRVNISDDRFLRKGSYNKLFVIKNDTSTENQVLITVSCIYAGNPFEIFKAVKNTIIDSVVNMFPEELEGHFESVEVDFLGDDYEVSVETKEQASKFLESLKEVDENDSGCYQPPSPTSDNGW